MESGLEHAFFYASENHDRIYNAASFEYWLKKFFTTGVFTGDLQVTANDDMTVTLSGGYANVDGKVKFFEKSQKLQLETAHAADDRIDSIVIERNDTDRDVNVRVITGEYSDSPMPVTPVRENGVYQLVVAQISVVHGAVKITQADITDTRTDTELCGIVTGTVKEMDFSQFQAQFDGYFENYKQAVSEDYKTYQEAIQNLEDSGQMSYDSMVEILDSYTEQYTQLFQSWFENVKNQLSGDVAGNLQIQIEDLAEKEFHHYMGLTDQETEFLPDGSIVQKNGEASVTTTFGNDESGNKVITQTVVPTEGIDKYIKTTTIYEASGDANKRIVETYGVKVKGDETNE